MKIVNSLRKNRILFSIYWNFRKMLFALFLALNYGVFKIPTINFLATLTKTSILPNRNTIDILMISNTLEAADKLWNEGYYKKV